MVDKKRIICTVTTDPNYDQRMQRICTALSEAGYEVLLIGRKLPHSEELSNQVFQQQRMNLFFNKSFLFYAEYNFRLFFLLLFSGVDIICSIDLDSILPGFLISKLRSKVFVHDAHELFSEMPELNENLLAKTVWTNIEQFVFPRINYAYTESEGYQKIYHQKYPSTTFKVIRNVPFYYSTNRSVDDGKYILYQGALNVGRGLEEAVTAMQHIDEELWLAGEGDVSDKLRALVSDLDLQDKVKFLGWVKPAELREITKQAKIGLNLLEPSNRHYQLSFPNKLFDYIMAELPQISMNFPYYQQITAGKKIGVFIDELEPETIADSINLLLANENFYSECMAGCRELKEVHNWENEQKKLLSFYEKLPV